MINSSSITPPSSESSIQTLKTIVSQEFLYGNQVLLPASPNKVFLTNPNEPLIFQANLLEQSCRPFLHAILTVLLIKHRLNTAVVFPGKVFPQQFRVLRIKFINDFNVSTLEITNRISKEISANRYYRRRSASYRRSRLRLP